jgi:DNA (cytosine-5)-methyltransferase 1
LGFEWAGLSKPVLFCDIEPWSRKVLAKHWPDVRIAEDVKELASDPDGLIPDCDILTAGYPCQPFSIAGQRRGTEDDRHIWPFIFTIIQGKRPTWCVFKNVYGHVSMGLDQVLSDLEGEGYAARPFVVPACATDAPHRRDRLWIICRNVADTNSKHGRRRACRNLDRQEWEYTKTKRKSLQTKNRKAHSSHAQQSSSDVADTDSKRLQRGSQSGNARSVRAQRNEQPSRRNKLTDGKNWLTEPSVGRVANGIPRRVDRLKGLGNAIVPQIAQRIGQTIKAVNDG